MQKTKLGISVGLLGAVIYFAAFFGGYIPVILLVGYVLLMEENEWLKKAAIKAALLMISFGVLLTLIGLIPDLMYWISSVFSIFRGSFTLPVVDSIISVITQTIDIIRTCLFLVLGLKALSQGTVAIPFLDHFIDRERQQ